MDADDYDHNRIDKNTSEEQDKILREYYEDFDFDYIYTCLDDEEMIITDIDHKNQVRIYHFPFRIQYFSPRRIQYVGQ